MPTVSIYFKPNDPMDRKLYRRIQKISRRQVGQTLKRLLYKSLRPSKRSPSKSKMPRPPKVDDAFDFLKGFKLPPQSSRPATQIEPTKTERG